MTWIQILSGTGLLSILIIISIALAEARFRRIIRQLDRMHEDMAAELLKYGRPRRS